jgi:hypothetical protein
MTARIRHGTKHRHTHGADPGTPHERLNAQHAMPNRAEGAPMGTLQGSAPAPSPVPSAPPSPGAGPMPSGGGMAMGPPGEGSDDEGDQT